MLYFFLTTELEKKQCFDAEGDNIIIFEIISFIIKRVLTFISSHKALYTPPQKVATKYQ